MKFYILHQIKILNYKNCDIKLNQKLLWTFRIHTYFQINTLPTNKKNQSNINSLLDIQEILIQYFFMFHL